jgi:hypothetical protein
LTHTDWLKPPLILVLVGHFGHFFVADDRWWSAFARPAAPPFFFLLGYAQSRTIPLSWIWLGVILTVLESWNADWRWVSPNILLSLAFIRLARPYVQILLQRHGWAAFTLLVIALVAVAPSRGGSSTIARRDGCGPVQPMPAHVCRCRQPPISTARAKARHRPRARR